MTAWHDERRIALADLDAPGELALRLAAIEKRAPIAPPAGAPARGRLIRGVGQDVRYALFSLRRTPAFTAAVIATLALTIGPMTAILSIGNWLIWRPAPLVVQPERLAVVWFGEWRDSGGVSPRRFSDANLADLQASSQTMAGIAGWQESRVNIAAAGVPPRLGRRLGGQQLGRRLRKSPHHTVRDNYAAIGVWTKDQAPNDQ
jgi:hypothetical protein